MVRRYITRVPLVIPSILLILGVTWILWSADSSTWATISLRLSQAFLNLFTIIPLSIIAFGAVIISYAIKDRRKMTFDLRNKNALYGMIDLGSIIILIGLSMFGFYTLD